MVNDAFSSSNGVMNNRIIGGPPPTPRSAHLSAAELSAQEDPLEEDEEGASTSCRDGPSCPPSPQTERSFNQVSRPKSPFRLSPYGLCHGSDCLTVCTCYGLYLYLYFVAVCILWRIVFCGILYRQAVSMCHGSDCVMVRIVRCGLRRNFL